jgi:signal transduction histidine kinase
MKPYKYTRVNAHNTGGQPVDIINEIPRRWRDRTANILSAYRFIGLITAFVEVTFIKTPSYSGISPILMVFVLGIYTIFKVLHPTRWYRAGKLGSLLLGIDVMICLLLTSSTGGLNSVFLLYTLSPVLTAAFFMESGVSVAVAGITAAYVTGAYVWNPLSSSPLLMPDTSQLSTFIAAVSLSAVLPYLVNVNLRQQLQSQDIFRERQRMARDLHDGVSQTLSALNWQLELLNRRLKEMGINLKEAEDLGELTKKAQENTLESLDMISSTSLSGGLVAQLNDYLKRQPQELNIDFRSDIVAEDINLEPTTELELLRICQEAITNIRKHAGAHNVKVQMRLINKRLKLSISDNGKGFDVDAYYSNGAKVKGHGLTAMRQRAESIGGKFLILSSREGGTEVQVEVPVVKN